MKTSQKYDIYTNEFRILFNRLPNLRLDIAMEDLEWRDVTLFHSLVRLPVRWSAIPGS